jgi:hypothetical protein
MCGSYTCENKSGQRWAPEQDVCIILAVTSASLTPIAEDLWVVSQPLRFLGLFPIGCRMTVIRLSNGTLWLCSPVAIDDELAAMLDGIGPVAHLVGPNRFHHLQLGPAHMRYPNASLHLAPGLGSKRPDLAPALTLSNEAPEGWRADLDQRVLDGVPTFNEVAFLHHRSRTLILTDHLFNLDDSHPASARTVGSLLGVRRAPGFPVDARLFFVRDREALARSIAEVLRWDFDRIVVTHGRIVEAGGRDVLRNAYRFLGV